MAEVASQFQRRMGMSLVPPMRHVVVLFCLSGWPFFWSGFDYGKYFFFLFPLVISVMFLASGRKAHINIYVVALLIYLSVVLLSTALSDYDEVRSKILTRAILYVFLIGATLGISSMKYEELVKAANSIMRIFVAVSLPSIVIFASHAVGLELAYSRIDLGWGDIHRLYPFGVITERGIIEVGDWLSVVRISGFCVEPGVLGGYVVFFLILNRYIGYDNSKRLIDVLLHVLGILSFSLFYFVSAFLFMCGSVLESLVCERRLSTRVVLKVLSVFLIVGGMYVFVVRGNPLYYLVNARIYHPELGLLAGNSREVYDARIVQYLQSVDLPRLIIGNGPGSNSLNENAGYASWTSELYDTGILNLGVVGLMFLLLLIRVLFVGIENVFYVLPSFLSFYHRPEMIGPIVIIFWVVIWRYTWTTSPVVATDRYDMSKRRSTLS